MKSIDFTQFNTLIAMTSYFNTEEICRKTIIATRWADGDVVCPYCGGHHCPERKDGRFYCKHCNNTFSFKVGTIFQGSKVSLVKWFIAMYLISSHKKGISSYQVARDVKVQQKTAWYMMQKVRRLYAQDDTQVFEGDIELDEVYIGGKEKWKHKSMKTPHTQGRSTATKVPVFGLLERLSIYNPDKDRYERMSYVHAFRVPKTDGKTLLPIVGQFVKEGSRIITDELNSYNGLSKMGYTHEFVNHGAQEYVIGSLFTNNIENFWSHFRRMITGCYHNISEEHLQDYIDEAVFRWNTRKMDESQRFAHMFEKSIGLVVPYEKVKLCKIA